MKKPVSDRPHQTCQPVHRRTSSGSATTANPFPGGYQAVLRNASDAPSQYPEHFVRARAALRFDPLRRKEQSGYFALGVTGPEHPAEPTQAASFPIGTC